jgi:hypothetical protein
MSNRLRVGNTVNWRGAWGTESPKDAVVKSIEINCRNKQGDDRFSVDWDKVTDRSVIVTLDNGHWAYGNQISPK